MSAHKKNAGKDDRTSHQPDPHDPFAQERHASQHTDHGNEIHIRADGRSALDGRACTRTGSSRALNRRPQDRRASLQRTERNEEDGPEHRLVAGNRDVGSRVCKILLTIISTTHAGPQQERRLRHLRPPGRPTRTPLQPRTGRSRQRPTTKCVRKKMASAATVTTGMTAMISEV
jgi:hypothetical protein